MGVGLGAGGRATGGQDNWQPGKYLTARSIDRPVKGRIYRGLGLSLTWRGSPKGRRPPGWTLTHLGSGHAVCNFSLHEEAALALASEIAECGDWEFEGLTGWKNIDPDLPEKFRAIRAAHPEAKFLNGGGHQHEEAARAIAQSRA